MKKLCLVVAGLFLYIFSGFAQTGKTDSSQYKPRKLSLEEASLVSSYYRQDGNNSAITGGIGTEKLTDIANTVELKFFKYDRRNRKHTLGLDLGIDHYTSASSDKIDPSTLSSASYADTRFYPSVSWQMQNEEKGRSIGAGLSSSTEFDYQSVGVNFNFGLKTQDGSGEFNASFQAYLDQLRYILPVELRTNGDHYPTKSRNSFSSSLSYSQVINQRLQIILLLEAIYQKGYLGLPFHRVYFADNSLAVENLPETRFKLPVGFRANYFAGDRFIFRTFYRYYQDSWGLKAHTAELEMPVKLNSFFSISPFYRFYHQTAVDYFAAYRKHPNVAAYYTSNYDLSAFDSHFYGLGFHLAPPKGVAGMRHFSAIELRYGHYNRSNGLKSDILSMHLSFK